MRDTLSSSAGFRMTAAVLLLVWMVLGFVGARRRMAHDRFKEYLGTELEGYDPAAGAVIGLSPGFVLAVNLVAAAAVFAALLWVTSVLNRSTSLVVHYVFSMFTFLFLLITAVMSGTGFVESLFWSFWTFAAHHGIWLLFVAYTVWYLWKKVNTRIVYSG
ncbi:MULTISPECIES: hypothetical protein [Salibacterium]|uniref:Uncharacterized protein n=2 Tax=Salibacterium TaxID=1884429 RepID=A0A1I4LNU0_9BACI|nr:hypothetical protein [Salibacterium qingdaonense]SFL92506.1 hypothetical protein SAMN04488054_10873 [Salibacterium qingdaonense]